MSKKHQNYHPIPLSLQRGRRHRRTNGDFPITAWPALDIRDLPVDVILPRLGGVTAGQGRSWSALCPAHGDSRPSLSVAETEDHRIMIYCHAGCPAKAVLAAIGLELRHLYPTNAAIHCARLGRRADRPTQPGRPSVTTDAGDPSEDVIAEMTAYAADRQEDARTAGALVQLAELLRLPAPALLAYQVGWHDPDLLEPRVDQGLLRLELPPDREPYWTFPERDARGRVVGIIRRWESGEKRSRYGSTRGLVIPVSPPACVPPASPVYVAEGHTDTIALHAVGCLAVGRPAARASRRVTRWLAEYLLANPDLSGGRPIIIVGDTDPAGRLGAEKTAADLRQALRREVQTAYPPPEYGDMREFICAGSFSPTWPS